MAREFSARPFPYEDRNNPGFHKGVVAVTGSLTVDLGIRHANFMVFPSIKGGQADLESAPGLAWNYGTVAGTFVISVSKLDTGNLDTDPATVAVNVSFLAIAGASVE